jgi:ankyrin repeat protein
MNFLQPRDLLCLLQAFPQLRESLSKQLVLDRNLDGNTLLHLTAENGDVDLMKYLLSIDGGASISDQPNGHGRTPMSMAAGAGHKPMAILLLDRNDGAKADSEDDTGNTPLQWAAANGHVHVVRYLAARWDVDADHANHDGYTALIDALKGRHKAVFKFLGDREDVDTERRCRNAQMTPLLHAAYLNYPDIVRLLLERYDANIDATDHDSRTALELAAEYSGDPTTIELLLARIDQREDPANYRTKQDWDAIRKRILKRALRCEQKQIV